MKDLNLVFDVKLHLENGEDNLLLRRPEIVCDLNNLRQTPHI